MIQVLAQVRTKSGVCSRYNSHVFHHCYIQTIKPNIQQNRAHKITNQTKPTKNDIVYILIFNKASKKKEISFEMLK